MREWLKDRLLAQMILNATFALLVFLVGAWITGFAARNANTANEIQTLKIDKASKIELEDKIKTVKEDQLVKDQEQDTKIETIRSETREDYKEINGKLDRLIEMQMNKNK